MRTSRMKSQVAMRVPAPLARDLGGLGRLRAPAASGFPHPLTVPGPALPGRTAARAEPVTFASPMSLWASCEPKHRRRPQETAKRVHCAA